MKKPFVINLTCLALLSTILSLSNYDGFTKASGILILSLLSVIIMVVTTFFLVAKEPTDPSNNSDRNDKTRRYIGLSLILIFLIVYLIGILY